MMQDIIAILIADFTIVFALVISFVHNYTRNRYKNDMFLYEPRPTVTIQTRDPMKTPEACEP